MRGELSPVTREKIEAFARRRRALILARGACAVFAILLALMSGLAILDYFVLLPDAVRIGLSASAYLAAGGVAWISCARLIWRSDDAREMARLMEQTRPELHEDLLSAVELGDPSAAERWDSEDFREALQEGVAQRVRAVDVPSVLSFRRIRPWVAAGALVGAGVAGLFFIPGLRYDHLLLRSLLPMANLERISRVQVAIVEPSPPERTVPQGDLVPVRIELSGDEADRAFLETRVEGRAAERVEMAPAGGRRFDSAVVVGRDEVLWRVLAGDAVTRWYRLAAVPRPEVIAFHKTFTYPEYAKKAPKTETHDGGDLVEIEGTVADVEVEVNRPVRAGELRIEQGGKSFAVPLEPGSAPGRRRARVALTASGTYRVHLLDAETAFENKFSPQYEIRALPDLLPRVTLEDPSQDLILPPDEVVVVRGTAKDDLGLRVVAQAVRINQGEWKEWVLKEEPGLQAAVTRRWDLFEMGVSPGDRISTKLVATDLKGNRAETSPIGIVITAPGFDPQRHVPLAAKEAAYEALAELRDAARAREKRAAEAAQAAGAGDLARAQALLLAAADAEKAAQKAEAAEARLRDALRVSRPGREAYDLVLAALSVRRLREHALVPARADLERATAGDAGAVARAREHAGRAAAQAVATENGWRDLLAAEEAVAALLDLRDLLRDERGIHRQLDAAKAAGDAKAWERLSRRQGVAVHQLKTVEEVLRVLALRAERGLGGRASRVRQELEQARAGLEKALAEAPGPSMHGPSAALQRGVEHGAGQLAGLEHEIARRAESARDRLGKAAETNADDVRRAASAMEAVAAHDKRRADLSAKNAPGAAVEAERVKGEEASRKASEAGRGARVQLEARAGTEETRKDADPFFVADASLAGRAMQAVLDGHAAAPEGAKTLETLRVVDRAYRTLETGHALAETAQALRELAEAERWHAAASTAGLRHPKDWRWVDERMKALPERLKDAGFAAEIGKELAKAWRGGATDPVRREMQERSNAERTAVPQAPALDRLAAELAKASAQAQPAMEAARKELMKLVPSLHERLKHLSEAAERIQQKTGDLADRAPQSEAAQVRPEARGLLENQQGLDRQIEEVMAELRRDANVQDLFTPEGRERARDADDAVAMLRQAPPKAEDLLAQAAAAPQPAAQEHALEQASEQQGRLAEALDTLARHYENAAEGRPEETRPELRAAEEELGIRPQLDAQYREMEKLAELARQSPEALKAALSEELARNEAMRRELQELSQAAIDRAEQKLQQASQTEKQTAQQLGEQAKAQEQTKQGLAQQAKQLAEEARRMAREEVAQVAKTAAAAKEAQKDLNEGAQDVPQNLSQPEAAAKGLESAAKEFDDAAADLRSAQEAAKVEAAADRHEAGQEAAEAQAAQKQAEAAQQGVQQARQQSQQAAQARQQAKGAPTPAQQAQQAAEAAKQAAKAAEHAAKTAEQTAQAESAQADAAAQAAKADPKKAEARKDAQAESAQAKSAQQQAKAAAQAASKAEDAAARAEKASQKAAAAQAQNKTPEAQQAAQQAVAAAKEALQAAEQALAQAEQSAATARKSAEGESAEAKEAAQDAGAAEQAQAQAGQAAQKASQLAQQARQLAQAARAQATPPAQAAAQAAQAQEQVAGLLGEAQSDLQRAAQNQAAAGMAEEAATFSQVAQGVEAVKANEVAAAKQSAQSAPPAQAQQAAQAAGAAIDRQSQALAQARQSGAPSAPPTPAEGTPLSEAASEFLAQALDALHGAPAATPAGAPAAAGQPSSGPPTPSQQALQAAAQAQAQAMMQQRSQAGQPGAPSSAPGQSPFSNAPGQGKGAGVDAPPVAAGELPGQVLLRPGEWGKLPPALARDLLEAQREGVSGEYRAMVETYFRVIAEKARDKK